MNISARCGLVARVCGRRLHDAMDALIHQEQQQAALAASEGRYMHAAALYKSLANLQTLKEQIDPEHPHALTDLTAYSASLRTRSMSHADVFTDTSGRRPYPLCNGRTAAE
ncbi:hypothetical protein ACLBOM_36650 [Escherichia coli]